MSENTNAVETNATNEGADAVDTKETYVTGYRAAKVVNAMLARDGYDKEINPQLIYQYVSKGYLEFIERPKGTGGTQKLIAMSDLAAWYTKYTGNMDASGQGRAVENDVDELAHLLGR